MECMLHLPYRPHSAFPGCFWIGSRSALMPATTGKTTLADCGSVDFMAGAAIAPSPAWQTTPSAIILIKWQAPTRFKASCSNQPRLRLDGNLVNGTGWLHTPSSVESNCLNNEHRI